MSALARFLRYISYDTQSDEESESVPTSEKQKVLGELLAQELFDMGLYNAHMDEYGYVYGWLPATAGCEGVPCLGLVAHMDTSPDVSGANVKPRIALYRGGDIVLNEGLGIVTREQDFPSLGRYVGQEIVVTDGTTLLGADDKAGIAEIFSCMAHFVANPEIPHGRIAVAITPDEEVGRGTDHFNIEKFGAAVAYTVDGGELGEVEYENFNAAGATITIKGLNIHPGTAKNKMKNALLIATEFATMLPITETPAHTEGYEGFYHLHHMAGNESEATLSYLIRDHDSDKFDAKKAFLSHLALLLNEKYGAETVTIELRDQYRNMKEQIEPHMYLIHRAKAAMERVGVTPESIPIRGGTDGARLSYMGLPCPNLSTGGMNFHGIHECIPVPSLEKMVEVLIELVRVEQ